MFGNNQFKLNHDNDGESNEPHNHAQPSKEETESAGMVGAALLHHAMTYGPCSAIALITAVVNILRGIARNLEDHNA